jgi:hypothetical protein
VSREYAVCWDDSRQVYIVIARDPLENWFVYGVGPFSRKDDADAMVRGLSA